MFRFRRPPLARSAFLFLLGAALLTSACDDGAAVGDVAEVTVMTRNVYLGANIFRVTQATAPEDLPVIAAEIFGIMEANDYPARAGALAAEIAAHSPHLVGLQEVEIYRTQDPSDYVTGNYTANAGTVHTDFLQVLMDSLDARGLSYTVAAQVVNADTELPAAKNDSQFFDIRMTDHDVILARSDVQTANAGGQGYEWIVPYELVSGDTVWFERGYTWADATVEDVTFTFVNTHFEVSAGGQLGFYQNRQAQELVERFAGTEPVVLLGDFNTQPGENPYSLLTDPWTDAWTAVSSAPGLTCCQGEVLNTTQDFYERIDLILFGGAVDALSAEVIGDELADRTTGGLWPSDHAGLVATLRIEN
ncbi:MAG: endonuclease/exonuclease/phosphatase family protein [Longimicrobiales bacterium]